jgi:serine/threonine-protein kinase
MESERWRQIKFLLQSALEREPGERSAFLAAACADDDLLRKEVESLITSHEQAGGFIESPAFEVMAESLGDQTDSLAGQSFGPYQIIARIGIGGMGEVYSAEDSRLGRKIALKMLPAYFTRDTERVRRFQQEARAASALNHPNILTIHEIGQIDSKYFIATEFIEGETLRQHMAKTEMKLSETLDVAIQVTSALAAAHQAGIVHRDIKPENVMVRPDALIKVLDFGLAKLTERPAPTTNAEGPTIVKVDTDPGTVMGTVKYMAPEQARSLAVDARTDIFSLSVVLYEMIAGCVPFEGATMPDVLASLLKVEPPPLTQSVPDVPDELQRIVSKGLTKDREMRYQSAKDLLIDLKRLKQRLEVEAEIERSGSAESGGQKMSETAKPQLSIAVLPFVNMSADPENEYFCDGLAEELINALTKIQELRVAARTSAFSFKGRQVDVREIGQKLNVSNVVEGSVRKAGNRLRITAQLINVADGYHLWSERYDRQMEDVFAIQDEISLAIVEKLKVRLLGEEKAKLVRRYTVNLEAYDLYLKGRYNFNQLSADGFKKAVEYFKLALEQDPNYALAYAGLAESYAFLGFWGLTSPREALPKAKAAALKALALDDTLADVRHSLGLVCTFNYEWSIAEQEFKRAIELNPNYAFGHICYAVYLRLAGGVDDVLAEMRHAQELDPLSVTVNAGAAYLFYSMRLYDETIEQCQKTLKVEPNFFQAHGYLALAYARKGMYEESVAEWKTLLTLRGARNVARVMQRAYERAGYKGALIKVAEWMTRAFYLLQVLKYVPLMKRRYISPLVIATFCAEGGEKDLAFRWLNKAYKEREPQLLTLKVNPHWDTIRSDSRFEELLRKIGLEK